MRGSSLICRLCFWLGCTIPLGWFSATSADITGDGMADLVGWDQNTGDFTVWPSNGKGVGKGFAFGALGTYVKIFFADLNADGKKDLIGWNPNTGLITAWPSAGSSVGRGFDLARLGSNYRVYFADTDGDKKADLVGWDQNTGTFTVWPNTGSGVGSGFPFGSLVTSTRVYFADITGDGRDDLIGWNQSTGAFTVWASTGTQVGVGFPFGELATNQEVWFDDVTGDKKADLIARNPASGALTAWPSTGTSVGTGLDFGSLGLSHEIHLADVNGDCKADLVGRDPSTGAITVWPSTGSGIGVGFAFGRLGGSHKILTGTVNDPQINANSGSLWPLIGTTIHTIYVPKSPIHWNWYLNSSTFWETRSRPTLGYYDQTVGSKVQQEHYNQLKRAKVDYALISWFGDINNDPILDGQLNYVLETYVKTFVQSNQSSSSPPIRLAVLMEFGATNYEARLNYLKSKIYGKMADYQLMYDGKPLIELSIDPLDPSKGQAISYARSLGFYVVDSDDLSGGGSVFGAITMKTDHPNRITSFAGGVSPSVDITTKDSYPNQGMDAPVGFPLKSAFNAPLEAERLTKGCGTPIYDYAASGGRAVQSNGIGCNIVSSDSQTNDIPTTAQNLTEWYAIFRIKTDDITKARGWVIVEDSCQSSYKVEISSSVFTGNNQYAHIPVQFTHLDPNCKINMRVEVAAGRLTVDRIWKTNCQFRKPSVAEFDSQWQPLRNLPLPSRPAFVTIASFNAWEEGSAIETSTVFGPMFLDRAAYWIKLLKKP
ncbi:MAG: FG-GAP-like repeat-containing protein [Bdellovibrionales bacterium]